MVTWSTKAASKRQFYEDQYDDDDQYTGGKKLKFFFDLCHVAEGKIEQPIPKRLEVPTGSGIFEYIDRGYVFYYQELPGTGNFVINEFFVPGEDNPNKK